MTNYRCANVNRGRVAYITEEKIECGKIWRVVKLLRTIEGVSGS